MGDSITTGNVFIVQEVTICRGLGMIGAVPFGLIRCNTGQVATTIQEREAKKEWGKRWVPNAFVAKIVVALATKRKKQAFCFPWETMALPPAV